MRRLLYFVLLAGTAARAEDLRLEDVRHSLTGTHLHYRKFIDGIPVLDGERIEKTLWSAGTPAGDSPTRVSALHGTVYLYVNGKRHLAKRQITGGMVERYAEYRDVETNVVVRREALFYTAAGRVFDPNPVTKLNDPSLRDRNDGATAVPDSAYSVVDLPGLAPFGVLTGANVSIVDVDPPSTTRADASQSLLFTRDQPQFEEVNAYFHIDRSQRYLQSLGFTGPRAVVAYAIPVDPHAANRTDNSYFVGGEARGRGMLLFGDGGTDDAEDSDIMLHEFAHAIHEWIAPGAFSGASSSEARAMAEGFGDYWAFSSSYAQSVASARDPFCVGEWDARCGGDDAGQNCSYPPNADCLRRVDQAKTMADFIPVNSSGIEHINGEIWSSTLHDIFLGMTARYGEEQGRRVADTIVVESLFGAVRDATFASQGIKLLEADAALNGGANAYVICRALTTHGILSTSACGSAPRGEVTRYESATSTIQVFDARAIEDVAVRVQLDGVTSSARVTLIAPNGVTRVLSASPETDATYGVDTPSAQSLSALFGSSAAGQWTIVVDGARLRSWSLIFRFAGDSPLSARPVSGQQRKHVPVVAHVIGAATTLFVTDVVIYNRAAIAAQLMMLFTPTGKDGRNDFAAIRLVVPPGQTIVLDDVVGTTLQSTGIGQLELMGDTDRILITARTSSPAAAGAFTQNIPVFETTESGADIIAPLENSSAFRSNIGVTEISGQRSSVRFSVFEANGALLGSTDLAVEPFGHVQSRLPFAGRDLRVEARALNGNTRVFAYGSVVDNFTGDAFTVPAKRVSDQPSITALPVAFSAPGDVVKFRSDAWLTTRDIVEVRRDVRTTVGFGFEPLFVSAPNTIVSSRTYAHAALGTYGQFIPALAPSRIGDPWHIVGVEESDRFYTVAVLINFAEHPTNATLIVYDSSGTERGRVTSTVGSRSLQQVPLAAIVSGTVLGGRVEVRAEPTVAAFATVTNKGTQDPFYIAGQH